MFGEDALAATDSPTITHSILSADALMDEVAAAYAIDTPNSCHLLLPSMNDTYLVSTAKERLILRVYRARWRSLPEILYELGLLHHLADRGLSVSLPVADREGALVRTVQAPEGHRHFVLFEYADGAHLPLNDPANCYRLGQVAAEIHTAAADFTSKYQRPAIGLEYLIDVPMAVLKPFFEQRAQDWAYLEGFVSRLRTRVEAMMQSNLDWGICHGDLAGGNVHISDNGTLTVFDFDLCGESWRGWDLAPIQRLAFEETQSALWDAFLKGYSERRPLGAADLTIVWLLVAVHHLWRLGLQASNVADWGILRVSDSILDRELNFFREWETTKWQGE
jgi:Ser/Thr protein kinase RdoA (MazF antagonist)